MHRFARLYLAAFVILLLWSPNSFAVGLGAYMEGAGGSGEAEWDSDYDSYDIDSKTFSAGLVLDTAPTNERVFNYRLNIGYVRQELEDEQNVTIKTNGVVAENIFGFAFIRNDNFRWWGGPLVRVGYHSGDIGTVRGRDNTSVEVDFELAEFGVGGVTGLNFKAGKVILAPSIGFRYSGYVGEGTTTVQGLGAYEEDFTAYTANAFANFAVLF